MGLVASTAEEVDMVEVGDWVLVESEKVGAVTRSGVVTDVDGRLITVRWDSGSSSTFVPSAGCLQVTGHEPQAKTVTAPSRSRQGPVEPHSEAPGP
jgi:hypothetical protein